MKFVKWFVCGVQDIALVGGKNASLDEMIRNLGKKGVSIPPGFAITAEAYKY
jgi:pyruvate,water dikinase